MNNRFQFHLKPTVSDYTQVFNWKHCNARSNALIALKDYESKEHTNMIVSSLVLVDTILENYDLVLGVVSIMTKSFKILHIKNYAINPECDFSTYRLMLMKTLARYAVALGANDLSITIPLHKEQDIKYFLSLGMHRNAYDYTLYHFEFRDGIRALANIDTWESLGNGIIEKEPNHEL